MNHEIFKITSVCFISVLILMAGNTDAADWPYWRGPDHNGISTETNFNQNWSENEPQVLWNASLGWGFSAVAVKDGKVFATGNIDNNDILYCFDAVTGESIWQQSYPEPRTPRQYEGGPNASPVVHDKIVYTLSKQGKIFARNTTDGSVIWQIDLIEKFGIEIPTWGLAGSALIVNDMVIFNVGSYGMAFNKDSGELIWENGSGKAGYATPVPFVYNGTTKLAMFAEKELAIIASETGQVVAKFPWPTRYDVNAADPVLFENKIFISSGYNQGCALLRIQDTKLQQIWQNKNMRNHMNSSVLLSGNLYGFDESQLKCVDFQTGQVNWSKQGLGKGSLMLAGETLIILSEDGRLILATANPEEYEQVSEMRILQGRCWTVPVLANGLIYARNARGDLVCIDLRK